MMLDKLKSIKKLNLKIALPLALVFIPLIFVTSSSSTAFAARTCGNYSDDSRNIDTKFDFGCLGKNGPMNISPIKDMAFAIIRFLSIGVGIIITLSIILAGIQYSASEGNPEATTKAKQRIISAVIGLAIYIFTFAIMQYLVPGGIFNPGIWLIDQHEMQGLLIGLSR